MKFSKKIAAAALALTVLGGALVTTNFSVGAKVSYNKNAKINLAIPSEPFSLDSAIIQYTDDGFVASHIFEGLTRLNQSNKVVGGVASKWTHSKDYKTWTFTLRSTAKWSDGSKVTPQDFIYAWKKALDPKTAAPYAYQLYYIKNGEKVNGGKAPLSSLGLKASGNTLTVTLEKPTVYFDSLMSFYTYFPQKEAFVKKHAKDYSKEKNALLYNGAWKIASWKHGSNLTLERNTKYWNTKQIKIKTLNIDVVKDQNTGVQRFFAGKQDSVAVLGTQTSLFKSKGYKINSYNRATIYYVKLNETAVVDGKKLYANKNIRKALALSIDRKEFCDKILKDGSDPATGLVAPGINGAKGDFRKENGTLISAKANVKTAKADLAKGLKELGLKKLPQIKYTIFNTDTNKKFAQVFQGMWKKNLGIDVQIDIKDGKTYSDALNKKDFQMAFSGWGPDYNDAMTFIDLWQTGGGNNDIGYSNKEYDKLVDHAKATTNTTQRVNDMKKAEKIFMNDSAIVPLFFSNGLYATSKKLSGVVRRPFSPDPDYYYASVK